MKKNKNIHYEPIQLQFQNKKFNVSVAWIFGSNIESCYFVKHKKTHGEPTVIPVDEKEFNEVVEKISLNERI